MLGDLFFESGDLHSTATVRTQHVRTFAATVILLDILLELPSDLPVHLTVDVSLERVQHVPTEKLLIKVAQLKLHRRVLLVQLVVDESLAAADCLVELELES